MLHVVGKTLDLYGMVVTAKLPESYLVTTPTLPLCLVIAWGTTYDRCPSKMTNSSPVTLAHTALFPYAPL